MPESAPEHNRAGCKRVLSDLGWCGPDCKIPRMGLDQAFDYCEKLARAHYENFSVTNFWLPSEIRPHFASIYAYCRWSDDLADEIGDSSRSRQLLTWWQGELHKATRGQSLHPVFVALHHTMQEYSLKIDPFEDLLSAFLQDQSVQTYVDDLELLDYCRRSANPVGRLILGLAKSENAKSIQWSDSICTGLQLANFCQDVRMDALRGRFYLPRSRMLSGGITQDDWRDGTGKARETLSHWIDHAREFFAIGQPLIDQGPNWLRRSVRLFLGGGMQILDNIERNRFDVWTTQAKVSKLQKFNLVARALLGHGNQRLKT